MLYLILVALFLFFFVLTCVLVANAFFKFKKISSFLKWALSSIYCCYFCFIFFGTGPNLETYPLSSSTEYFLPWEKGLTHFVSQGHRSFTTHRGLHEKAWDFVMPLGTKVVAAREGIVVDIEDSLTGVGWRANSLKVQHPDGTIAIYAHIQKNSVQAARGDRVQRGQWLANCGMVGMTLFPHLHFVVVDRDERQSLPITFKDVQGGLPLAGKFYKSENKFVDSQKGSLLE